MGLHRTSPCIVQALFTIELSLKSLKEGRNHGFYPSLTKFSFKSLVAHRVSEPILEVFVQILETLLSTSQTLIELWD